MKRHARHAQLIFSRSALTAVTAVLLSAAAILLLTACAKEDTMKNTISDVLGVDLSDAKILSSEDTRGWFGDGHIFVTLDVEGVDIPTDGENWHPLPLSETMEKLVYGVTYESEDGIYGVGPFIDPVFPKIENGAYFFLDRHDNSRDPKDESGILDRPSINVTVAMLNTDTHTLYYGEFNT